MVMREPVSRYVKSGPIPKNPALLTRCDVSCHVRVRGFDDELL